MQKRQNRCDTQHHPKTKREWLRLHIMQTHVLASGCLVQQQGGAAWEEEEYEYEYEYEDDEVLEALDTLDMMEGKWLHTLAHSFHTLTAF